MYGFSGASGQRALNRRLGLLAFAFIVLGTKIWLIQAFGSPAPVWDEWDAEAAGLYQPYLAGNLQLGHWIGHHNEHRIVLTRAMNFLWFWLSGRWDPPVQMLANAAVHTVALTWVLWALSRRLTTAAAFLLTLFGAVLMAIPFGSANLLAGFQVQFYLLILLSLPALYLVGMNAAWSSLWITGTLLAVLAYFSLASGALTLLACAALALVQIIGGQRNGAREWLGIAIHLTIALLMVLDIPNMAHHSEFKATGFLQWFGASLIAGAWPFASSSWPAVLRAIPVLLVQAPLLLFAVRFVSERAAISDARWFSIGLAMWLGVQFAALAYGRVHGVLVPRYYDIYTLGTLLNFACLLHLISAAPERKRFAALFVGGIWIFVMAWALGQKTLNNVRDDLAWRGASGRTHVINLRGYLTTDDFAHLRDKTISEIPYPSAERLREVLADPAVRAILPEAINGRAEPGALTKFKQVAFAAGPMLLPLGAGLLLIAALGTCFPVRPSAPDEESSI